MKKPIEVIKPNPHRNFEIYPIGETQVKILMDSIADVGMFLGLPARKTKEGYEIACGHHRLEALKRTGITHVDLAVNDYSDEDMLKIMIRENSTQRGNENFGAVLDSVGAVLVQCVKDVYDPQKNNSKGRISDGTIKGQLESKDGIGIGHTVIQAKEPSLSTGHIKAALATFRSTGGYLKLLKKGGLPEQFWHLYDNKEDIITTIEAVAQFPKPAHAAAWIKGIDDPRFTDKVAIEAHAQMIREMMGKAEEDKEKFSVVTIQESIVGKIKTFFGEEDTVYEKKVKTLDEEAEEISKAIKSLKNKIIKFKAKKEILYEDVYLEDLEAVIEQLMDCLDWLKTARTQGNDVIDIHSKIKMIK